MTPKTQRLSNLRTARKSAAADDPVRLHLKARQAAWRRQFDFRSEKQPILKCLAQRRCKILRLDIVEGCRRFDDDGEIGAIVALGSSDRKLLDVGKPADDIFDSRRID